MTHSETIIIRKAILTDLPMMLRIMGEALDSPSNDDEMEEQYAHWLLKFHNTSQFIFYVVEIDHSRLIGWCRGGQTVEVHKTVAQQIYDCEIQNIFILQQYQHRGIGRELWKIVWNDVLLRFHPKNFVVWSVNKEQAHKFYLSLGGIKQEERTFTEGSISTAFIWNELKLYEFTNFLIYK
jgi:ribosomal protein S18 acetylase RimI-like enzyme